MAEPVNKNAKSALCQNWVHSREEDTATEAVYRPAGYPLPPSRGRPGFKFEADGTFKRIGIGATDISQVKQGTWQFDDDKADQVRVEVDGQPQLMKIEDLHQDRMTIKKGP